MGRFGRVRKKDEKSQLNHETRCHLSVLGHQNAGRCTTVGAGLPSPTMVQRKG